MKKIFSLVFILFSLFAKADYWTQKANFPGGGRHLTFSFSIGNKGYVGYGKSYAIYFNDFWEYDPATNVWTQKANFGGMGRLGSIGFSIGSKGYAGLGIDSLNNFLQDFWEYNVSLNTWTQKADFAGGPRAGAVAFNIGSQGYVSTGAIYSPTILYDDLWSYDPAINTWTQKANLPASARSGANCFVIGNNGYIVAGWILNKNVSGRLNDLWQYNPITNSWVQKANFTGSTRADAAAFSICDLGYFGTGDADPTPRLRKDFWQYNPVADAWVQKTDYGGNKTDESAYFSIGTKGYLGLGSDDWMHHDFWEYTPDSACATGIPTISPTENFPISISPNPFTTTTTLHIPEELLKENCSIIIFDARGKKVFKSPLTPKGGTRIQLPLGDLGAGIYFYRVISKEKILGSGKMVIE